MNNLESLNAALDFKVDAKNIPQGVNNALAGNISFEFGQAGYYTTLARFTEADK